MCSGQCWCAEHRRALRRLHCSPFRMECVTGRGLPQTRPVQGGLALFGSQKESSVLSSFLQCNLTLIDWAGQACLNFLYLEASIMVICLRACEKASAQQMPHSSEHRPDVPRSPCQGLTSQLDKCLPFQTPCGETCPPPVSQWPSWVLGLAGARRFEMELKPAEYVKAD